MADRVLREACEHGRYESCDELITNGVPISPDGVKHSVFSWKPCPGGREVTDEQIGWFNPGSKRFCYSDEKVVDAEHLGYPNKESYTEPVFIWKSV